MMPTSHQNMRLASTIAAAESVLDQAVAQGDLRLGLAMIASSEGILFQHAVGARDVEGQSPVDIDAIIAMASMTKLVTTVAALQLVEGGALSLDEPVNHYLPALERVQILVEFRGDEPVYKPAPRAPTAAARSSMSASTDPSSQPRRSRTAVSQPPRSSTNVGVVGLARRCAATAVVSTVHHYGGRR